MVGLSPAGEAAVITALTTTAYISLHAGGDPGTTGAFEITGGGYARPTSAVTFTNTGNEPTIASNTAVVPYPIATSAWGAISYFGLWTAAIGGTFLGYGAISPPVTVNSGDTAHFIVGSLTITVQ